jgi:hypothetical protein
LWSDFGPNRARGGRVLGPEGENKCRQHISCNRSLSKPFSKPDRGGGRFSGLQEFDRYAADMREMQFALKYLF